MRPIRKALYDEVFEIATNITRAVEAGDTVVQEASLSQLQALYHLQEIRGDPEPFLTETLADYTQDATEAVRLYVLSLAQSTRYPDEPTYTKRIALAERLIDIGEKARARTELIIGRAEADRLRDKSALENADDLLSKLTV